MTKDQKTPAFSIDNVFVGVTLLRVWLSSGYGLPNALLVWLQAANVQSVLVDPVFTTFHVEEAAAIRHLSSGSFSDSYVCHGLGNCPVHLPPLLLALVEGISSQSRWILTLFVLLLDIRIAMNLERLARNVFQNDDDDSSLRKRQQVILEEADAKLHPPMAHIFPSLRQHHGSLLQCQTLPLRIAQLYYANPVTIMVGSGLVAGGCFQNVKVAWLLEALAQASCSRNNSSVSSIAFWLSLALFVDSHAVIFLVPIFLWTRRVAIFPVAMAFTAAFHYLSFRLVDDHTKDYFSIVLATHFSSFHLGMSPSLTPLWYFGMEVFLRFRTYFSLLLGGIPYLLIAPTTIRLHLYPCTLVALFWFLGILFRPPSTLYNLMIGYCLLLLNPNTLAYMKQMPAVVALCAWPIPVMLYSVCHWLWLETVSGEANFVFFQSLAYSVFVALLFLNFASAALRRDKIVRLTEKKLQQAKSS